MTQPSYNRAPGGRNPGTDGQFVIPTHDSDDDGDVSESGRMTSSLHNNNDFGGNHNGLLNVVTTTSLDAPGGGHRPPKSPAKKVYRNKNANCS